MDDDDDFMRLYAPFVGKIVADTRRQLGLTAEVEDLMAYGYAGLLEARTRFDASRGVGFKTFAYYRVHGAILNGALAMGGMPRRMLAKLRAAEAIDDRAEPLAGVRPAAGNPLTTEQSLRAVDDILGRAAVAYTATLAYAQDDDDSAESSPSPEDALGERQLNAEVARAVAALGQKDRGIIEGHYGAGRPLDEVTAELGYSRSGGRSAHSRVMGLLRQSLRDG